MILYNLDKLVKTLIKKTIDKNSVVVDATCGNGNDTLFLANIAKEVYAFDIQDQAIINSKNKCSEFSNINFIQDSHANFDNYISNNVDLIMYNLGYLPNSHDELITTTSSSTIDSITSGLKLLNKNKFMILTIYTGHDNGLEANIVSEFLKTLSNKEYLVMQYQFCNLANPPFVMVVEKK